jgi:osmotically inducible protein OsmC
VLTGTPYSFRTRFENEKGTNPEELIAAAHAGCFSMTMAFVLQGAGYTPTELSVEAAVTIEPEGEWFRISRSALTLLAQVPNLDQAAFARMIGDAETEKDGPLVQNISSQLLATDSTLVQAKPRSNHESGKWQDRLRLHSHYIKRKNKSMAH